MKLLVLVVVCVCISKTATLSVENKNKIQQHKYINAIPLPQKGETYYHTTGQGQEYVPVPVPVMQKPMYVSAQPTMLIIAQPAYIHPSPNGYYGSSPGMQQLLNYFHNNPQAKYQLLYGGYQQQQAPQTYVQHQPIGAQSIARYEIVPNPVYGGYNQVQLAAPSYVNYNQIPYHTNHIGNPIGNQVGHQIVHPIHQLSHLSHLSQIAAHPQHQFTAPIRSIPPVITGLENFTPEQQAQIKAHLGAHLGTQVSTSTSSTVQTTASQPQQVQYTTQPAQPQQPQEKNYPTSSTSSFTPSVLYRSQFTKGK